MAELPRASDLHGHYIERVRSDLGAGGVDTRNLSRFSVVGAGLAQMGVRSNKLVVEVFDEQILDRCNEAKLDAYCAGRGPVRRFAAAKARGVATFTRSVVTAGSGEIPVGTEIRIPYDGRSYVFVVRATKAVASTGLTVNVDLEAQATGAASNIGSVSAGMALTGLPAALWDATMLPTFVNVAGGADDESDEEMRERQRLWERSRQRCTASAIMFAARLVNGVKHVVLADVFDPHLGGWANLYIGDINWASTSTLRQEVAVSLEGWRGTGAALNVRGLAQSNVTVSARLHMARPIAFYDVLALREAGIVAALRFFDKRIDAYQYDTAILKSRLAHVHDEVAGVTLLSPTGDGEPSPISPTKFKELGYLPSTLIRFRTTRSLVTVDIEGPA